ncbi:RNA polymerase sigma factor, sigma-70 family protein [Bordetella holmesii 30539]|uniref:RNA polymerase sigma factor, sigma-70 family protein n=1 Tax=Bordetella holmesii 1058 TaxID=1247648 RepID=A0ABN0S3U6_9BORD|nr:RNA polymerase sigma factor, sigma-70 family protein [Bordetella holmesii ATCC 51541]EWM42680.1 RNA polymerase sigma factor, sigma-70 family protein [Bordetella holmesii 41130]EWM46939.1 RNA polymerase sigma factor, sigma-70 family protein [Bordetella holmesii 35009]EWM51114.1 RNA polymerase sigma factor, sigma-70 family protein [Bordetella holmesii 70147]EXF89966.1 RNA polymerase sigma factor, sigma-70 family protein [Bordetella holmesii 30539]EXX96175.1 RNA polymerase sigma factor, sigma-
MFSASQDDVHRLYAEHHGWLNGWLRKKLGNSFDAADLAQDTFLRVLRHRRELSAVREPRAYLVTIAGRLLLNHYRRRSLERAYEEALAVLPLECAPSPEQRLLVLETLDQIDALLAALPAKTRTAFLLAQIEHLSHAQIAEQLQISVRTVQRHILRAYEQCILALNDA